MNKSKFNKQNKKAAGRVKSRKIAPVAGGWEKIIPPAKMWPLIHQSKTTAEKSNYFDVKDQKDVKTSQPTTMSTLFSGIGVAIPTLKPIRVRCPIRGSISGSANTVLNTVTVLKPLASLDAMNFAKVFDVARCVGFDLYVSCYTLNSTNAPAAPLVAPVALSIAYDPVDATANSIGVENSLAAAQHMGPYMVTDQSGASVPDPVNNGGNWKRHFKIPAPVVDPGILTDLLGSNWVSATDTNVVVGYLKPYVDALGTIVHALLDYFVVYHMEFKSRV